MKSLRCCIALLLGVFLPSLDAAAAKTQVTLWHSYRGAELRALEQCILLYSKEVPDVEIRAVAIPFDAYATKLEASIPRGNGPDLFIGAHESLGEWRNQNLLAKFPDASADQRFLDGTVEPLRLGGQLYGLPLNFKSLALFYRSDLLATAPRDTDEVLTLSQAARRRGSYGLVYEAGSWFYHAAWLHGFGGSLLDGKGRPQLDSAASQQALRFVQAMSDARLLPEESSNTVAAQLWNDGQALMTINGPWFIGELNPKLAYAVAPLPRVSATGLPAKPLLTIEAILLSSKSQSPAAALAFAAWLADEGAGVIRASIGRQTVANRAAWQEPQLKSDPVLGAFLAQLPNTVAMDNRPEMRLLWEPGQRALRQVLRGGSDAQAALAAAQRSLDLSLAPPPPLATAWPYIASLVLTLLALAWLVRRRLAQRRREPLDYQAYWYLAPAVVALAVLVFIPLVTGATMSLFDHRNDSWRFVGLSNFIHILSASDGAWFAPLSFYFTLAVTLLWTMANVLVHLALGVGLALLLRHPLLRLRAVYRALLIVPWAIPNYITALIWKGLFHRQFGAINGLLRLLGIAPVAWFSRFLPAFFANLTTNVWLGFPFMMVVTLGALAQVPKELEEAAALDGATGWLRLRHVIFPVIRPALLPSVLLGAIWTFNMFNVVFLVSGGEPDGATEILISQAYRWAFTRGHRYGYAAAYAVLIFVALWLFNRASRRVSEAQS